MLNKYMLANKKKEIVSNICNAFVNKTTSGFRYNVGYIRHISKVASVIKLPVNLGQPMLGPDLSPAMLIENGLFDLLASCNWEVDEIPMLNFVETNSKFPSNDCSLVNITAKNIEQVGHVCKLIHDQVDEVSRNGDFTLILGGDHCISMGTMPALLKLRQNTVVIWVDAHADINTPATSLSGNMHGMPVGFLTGLVDNVNTLPNFYWFKPCLSPKNIIYIGLRDVDNAERKFIKELGIKAYSMHDIDKIGIGQVMKECIDYIHNRNIHLSFDIDAIDPFFAPHTGTAVRGGLTFRESNFICESLFETGALTSMELVEVNPSIHSHQEPLLTIEMALTLIGSTMGRTIL